MHKAAPHEANLFLRHKQGRRVPVNVRVQPMRGSDGSIIGAIEIFSDDSAQFEVRRQKAAMERLTFLDHLTQLPNRRYMEMSLHTTLSEYEVHKDPFGVLVIDLDRFKEINDSFGHSSGDDSLQEVAHTLRGVLRPTDTVGRWGGDEFLAIVRNIDGMSLRMLAERCVALVRETSIKSGDGRPIHLSISVGAALSRLGEKAECVIDRADELMYQSKTSGRSRTTTD
jgi:diguanylate cyclase (GGDEF)-like protein